jgi:hypothetical protein
MSECNFVKLYVSELCGLGCLQLRRSQVRISVDKNIFYISGRAYRPMEVMNEISTSTWPCSGWVQHRKLSMRHAWFDVMCLFTPRSISNPSLTRRVPPKWHYHALFHFIGYFRYDMSNCITNFALDRIYSTCGCRPPFSADKSVKQVQDLVQLQ